jgi:hypothetical protein
MGKKAQAPNGIMRDLLDLSRAASALSQKEGYPKQNVPQVGCTIAAPEGSSTGGIYFTNPTQFFSAWEALQRAR